MRRWWEVLSGGPVRPRKDFGRSFVRRRRLPLFLLPLVSLLAARTLFAQTDLGTGQFRIVGTQLDVSPQAQTVPVGTPTRVNTSLDTPSGAQLPPTVSVRGELTGPGIPGSLTLSTEPNGFFTIPAQSVRGNYVLSNIRLMDGERFVAYSARRDVTITVTDILIAQVTSRPLTYQEMLDKGIVVSPRNFRAYSFVFALQIESRLQEFEVPIIFPEFGPPVLPSIPRPVGSTPLPEGFSPPQVAPVRWSCADLAEDVARGLQYVRSAGGPILLPCGFTVPGRGDTPPDAADTRPVLSSLLLIPGDVAFLNQFFSLTLLVQNGAPTGSNLRLENITARASIPPALRAAQTNPPTNLSQPVPIVDPGPDGRLGTADDVTFLLAQSVGKAEYLVEGLRSGRWDVPIELNATLTGLPVGPIPLRGTTTGAVFVRNPSLFVTLDHPDTIRTGEEYTVTTSVTNTSAIPANQVSVKLDRAFITGAQLLSDETVALGNLTTANPVLAKFRMRALRTGRVTAAAFFGEGPLSGSVVLHAGIGELSIPLSPDTLVFPRSVERVPVALLDPAKRLLGLAWSIAKSPGGTPPAGLARVGEQATRWRINDLILAARHWDVGEQESVALLDFLLGWLNAGPDKSVSFDQLRRASEKGAEMAAAWGTELTRLWQAEAPFDFQKRIATELPDRPFLSAVLSTGSDAANPSARLVLSGRTIPGRTRHILGQADYERTLANAELYRASKAGTQYEAGFVGGPDPSGYQIQIAGKRGESVTLTVTYPGAGGKTVSASFGPFAVAPGSVAWIDLSPGQDPASLTLQTTNAGPISGVVALLPRPALRLVAAVQDLEADPRGHAVSLLFNRSLSAAPAIFERANYEVRSPAGVNAVSVVLPQQRNDPRRVIIGVTNHPSPYSISAVRVTQLSDSDGTVQAPDPQVVNLDVRDRAPGGSVEGRVIGAGGAGIANAQVILRMPATSDTTGQSFLADFAAATTNSSGDFFFEYVPIRQGTVFQLFAADPATGFEGDASGQVRTEAERVRVNIVLLARGDVTGRVLDEGGAPIANAFVTAESVFFKSDANRASGNSAANGTFLFRALPAGPVQLWAIDPVSRKSAFQVASIPAAGGTATQDIVITRLARASVTGTIVRERDGRPAAGLYVVMYGEPISVPYPPHSDRRYFGFRVTDSAGRFAFYDIQPGADLLQVFDFSLSRSPILERTLTILPDSTTVLTLVALEPQTRTGSVEGVVRISNEGTPAPLANSLVIVSETRIGAVTDSAGRYRLGGVPIGTRRVQAYNPGPQQWIGAEVVVQEGLVSTQDFLFEAAGQPSRTIRGTVVDPLDRLVPSAGVAEFDGSGNVVRSAIADVNGRFVFNDVPPGNHTFFALGQDDASGPRRDDVGSTTINFPGTGEANITIRLVGWGRVQGRVVGSHLDDVGNPVESPIPARLVLTGPRLIKVGQFGFITGSTHPLYPGDREANSSPSDGTYSIPDVLGGSYSIRARHPIYGDLTASGMITLPGQVATQNFLFSNALSWIDGFLYDERGRPITDAEVDLWQGAAAVPRDDPRTPPYATVRTISDPADPRGLGYFRFLSLPNRSFTLAFQGLVAGVRRFDQAFVTVRGAPHAIRVTLRARLVQDVRVRIVQPDANNELVPVPSASVSLRETEWPGRALRLDTAADGAVLFPGISEGRFTVNAQRLSRAGSGGGCVCADGGTVEVTIALPGSGAVRGTVRFPGTGVPVESAQVLVLSGGGTPVAAAQTDANGRYSVDGILLQTTFSVRVKDNASARFGFGADFVLAANGETVTRDVTLLALGNVSGTFSDGSGRGIPGATVVLRSDSLLGQTLFYSGTDGSGRFSFAGIPQGSYALSSQDPTTRLSGANEGRVETEGATVTTNLRAQASGTVQGRVLSASGAVLTIPPIVTIYATGIPARTVITSDFRFADLPLGPFTIHAEEQASPPKRRAVLTGRLTANGEVQNLELRYVPYGSVNVRVVRVNPAGGETALTRGSVLLSTSGVYRGQFPFDVWVNVNAQGIAQFVNVGGGELSATYRDPVTGVQSQASGGLASEGSTVELTVRVLNLSDVSGRVLKPPPVSTDPAPGTFVSLGARTVVSDAGGRFTFDGVAFGNGELVFENAGLGRGRRGFSLSSANAPLDVGSVILDGTAPSVVEVLPATGATGLSRNPLFTILFSEPVQIARSDLFQAASSFHVRHGSFSLSPDRRTLSWQANTLDPATAYQLRILAGAVTDDSGWPSAATFLSSFTTRDDVGPVVVQTAPIADAIQVPVSTTVLAIFDKDLDLSTITASALTVERTVPLTSAVPGNVQRGANDRTVVFTPNAPALETQSRYQARVAGLRDTTGNPMAQTHSFSFWTRDDVSPAVTFDPPPTSPFYSGNNYTLTLRWSDPDLRSIEARVNGYHIGTLQPSLSARSATFTYWVSPEDTGTEHVLTARPTDWSGNTGATARLTVPLVVDRRPTVSIQVTSPTTVSAGGSLSGRVTASDDRGLTLLKLYVSGPFSTNFEWRDVAGLSSATRDFTILIPPAAAAGGAVTLTGEATDNNDRRQVSSATNTSVTVLRDTVSPVIANVSPASGTTVLAASEVQISADITDDIALRSVSVDRPGGRIVSQSGSRFTLAFPAPAAAGDVTVTLTATDFGNNSATAAVLFRVQVNAPPTGTLSVSPAGPLPPNANLTATVDALDDISLGRIEVNASGALYGNCYLPVSGTSQRVTCAVRVHPNASPGSSGSVHADIFDAQGQKTSLPPVTMTVTADSTPPVISNVRPADGETYSSGDTVLVGANVSDDFGVASVEISVDGVAMLRPELPYEITYRAKRVSSPTVVPIRIEARDRAGNVTSATRSITVNPLVNSIPPTVALSCPTSGALFPPGHTFTLSGAAADDGAVEKVEFFLNDETAPFFTDTAAPYETSFGVPASLAEGATFTLRAKAWDFAGNTASSQSLVRVVQGEIVSGDLTIGAGDTSRDGRTLIIASGITTIDGPHAFARLVVLAGARVTRSSITTLREDPLDLNISGAVFVACGGSITVNGKGYLGGRAPGNVFNEGRTFGNVTGSGINAGGSHGGKGAEYDPQGGHISAPVYGSITRPAASGGGGGTGYYHGNNGGGVIMLRAAALIVDGALSSEGDGPNNVGGAGGSIDIETGTLSGSGRISASGSYGYSGSAGGGRAAVRYTDISGFERARILASGGDSAHPSKGSAGTVFLKSASQTYGDLIIDNVRNTLVRNPLPATGQTLRFDTVTARNHAKVISQDEVVAAFNVDSTSYVATPSRDAPPTITLTRTPTGAVLPGTNLIISAAVADDNELEKLDLAVTGAATLAQSRSLANSKTRTENFTVAIPTGATGSLVIQATVHDAFGRSTVANTTVPVSGDTTPPVLSSAAPPNGTSVSSGQQILIGVNASDNVGVVSVDITVDGATTTFTPPSPQVNYNPYLQYTARPVTVATPIPIRFVARDAAGNVGTLDWTITLVPIANPNAPRVSFLCPTTDAMFPPGRTITVRANATDDQAVARVEFYLGSAEAPFFTDTSAPYETSHAIPEGLTDGATFLLRAKAYDFAANVAETAALVNVVQGDTISADTTIPAGDTSRDGRTLIIASGTTTIDGPHTFARLVVLPGATVTQIQTTSATIKTLDVTISGATYIACGGGIDVSRMGYLAAQVPGNPNNYGLTYGGLPGSPAGAGGSHGGLGDWSTAAAYGSLYDPREPGGGSGAAGGPSGGGVVLLRSASLGVDGWILADGFWQHSSGGAGGSIRLDVGTLSGGGTIRAGGKYLGGGGRVAVFYNDMSGFDPVKILSADQYTYGGTGTVYLKSAAQSYGELILDSWDNHRGNTGNGENQQTPLPAIRSGTLTAVSGSTVTDSSKVFPYSVVGYSVEIKRGATVVGTYRVVSHSGGTLTLNQPVAGTVQVGDTYQGVIRLDMLRVRNGGRLESQDVIHATTVSNGIGTTPRVTPPNQTPDSNAGYIRAPLLRGDTLDLDGILSSSAPLQFTTGRLANTSVLTHGYATSTSSATLDLTISGTLTVDATSRIDVTEKGYLGGRRPPHTNDYGLTYNNAQGSAAYSGGSHGGRGSGWQAPSPPGENAPPYGSLFDPREPGGGSGFGGYRGGNGGGVAIIKAGTFVLNGSILADGYCCSAGGAGGSVRLDVGTLSGTGSIRASGGANGVSGGGGRVAVFYNDISAFDRTRITAPRSINGWEWAGAGTVLLKSAAQTYGELIVDNSSRVGGLTPIPAIGSGTITGVSGSTITDSTRQFPYSVVGLTVDIRRGEMAVGTYRVVSHTGGTLTLDRAVEGTVLVDDAYQGVLRLDVLTARNKARVITQDRVVATTLNVDASSYLAALDRDAEPTATLTANPPATVSPGGTLVLTVAATDDLELDTIEARVTGPVTFNQSRSARDLTSRTETFNVPIPSGTPSGTLAVTATVKDTWGHSTVMTAEIAVAGDSTPPTLSNPRPPDGASFASGTSVAVGVDAADETGVASVDIIVDGQTTTKTAPPYQITYLARPVTTPTTIPIRFVARDLAGNISSLDQTITVTPISNPNAPRITTKCPTTGAFFPAGHTFALSADVVDDQAVAKVEFFLNAETTPFFTDTTAPYETTYTVPTGLPDGATFTIRIRAEDFAANSSEATLLITVAAGDVISTDTLITSTDTSRDGRTLIITGGTTTISGPHPFARLIVLSGARVTHEATTITTTRSLNVTVAGATFVACGGSIDVSGKGYLGGQAPGNPIAQGRTFGNVAGSASGAGGSFGGRGGNYNASQLSAGTYGSLFDPRESGGGAGEWYGVGGNGGGAIFLTAGTLVLNGSILADGTRPAYSGGAGGSIRIDVGTLSGAGTIRAAGSVSGSGNADGGGGRIAVRYANISGFDRTRITAPGGGTGQKGGAGTVYLKSDTQTFGELVVDNLGTDGATTPLPAVGSGTVTAVSDSTLTDSSKTFPYSVVGLHVEVKREMAVVGTYRVLSHTGGRLTLDTRIQDTVRVGDTYQGVLRLDTLIVRNGGQLTTPDDIRTSTGPNGALSVTPASPVLAGQTLSATVTASDPGGLSRIDLQTSGALTSTQSRTVSGTNATQTFNVTIPLTATAGSTIQIVADIYDTQSRVRRLGPQIVTVAADTTPPVLSNARPPNGSSIASSLVARIGVDAADNVGVASVGIVVDGATTTKTTAPYEILYTARSVTIPTTVPIRFVARDYVGNSAALDRSIVITPTGALQALTITSPAVRGGAIPTGTVFLSGGAPSGGAVVTLTSSNPVAASVPASVTLPAGASWMGFPITTPTVASSTSVTITATYAGETKTATLSVEPSCSIPVVPPPAALPADTVWVEDQIPTGGAQYETWIWDAGQKASGTQSNTDPANTGFHMHYFQGASQTLAANAGDKLVAYVLLDPCDPPREVMLQWNDGSWEHRAFRGADLLGYGTPGTASRYLMGPLPPAGQWVRLEVPASAVALEGRPLHGMAFILYGGKAWFDRAGKITPAAAANAQPAVSLTAPANGATFTHPATVNLAATASDSDGSVAKVEFFWNGILIGEDTTSPYTLTWNPLWSRSYSLTARATDNLGASTTSTPASISVTGGPPGPFVGVDTTTKGSWRGVYGTDGYQVMEDSVSYPSYAQVTFTGHSLSTWAASSADVRALQKAVGSDRIAATWYSNSSFTVDLNFTDTALHRVAFYCLDWGSSSTRVQSVEVLNAVSGELLDSRSLSNFEGGHYLIWNLAGRVRFRFTRMGAYNAVVSGLFFDPATSP